tara:strand:+ start:1860 stop:2123 length:264 start_codon:yes stop_codon:yes gene_type:complete
MATHVAIAHTTIDGYVSLEVYPLKKTPDALVDILSYNLEYADEDIENNTCSANDLLEMMEDRGCIDIQMEFIGKENYDRNERFKITV